MKEGPILLFLMLTITFQRSFSQSQLPLHELSLSSKSEILLLFDYVMDMDSLCAIDCKCGLVDMPYYMVRGSIYNDTICTIDLQKCSTIDTASSFTYYPYKNKFFIFENNSFALFGLRENGQSRIFSNLENETPIREGVPVTFALYTSSHKIWIVERKYDYWRNCIKHDYPLLLTGIDNERQQPMR